MTDCGEPRKLLVVGSGFIASEIAQAAATTWGWDVHVLFRSYQNPDLAALANEKLPQSVREVAAVIDRVRPTDIVLGLGSSFVPDINRDVNLALEQHLSNPLRVLDGVSRAAHRLSGNILVIGSASEYGEFGETPVSEDIPARPRDHYGLTKLALRNVGLHFVANHALPIVHVRQFNVTGVRQDARFVVPSICGQIAQGDPGSSLRVVAGNIEVRRDFLDIVDACEAYRVVLERGAPGEVINVCSGTAHRIADLIDLAASLRRIRVRIEASDHLLRESDKAQAIICGDPTRLRALGWRQRVDMRDLLAKILDHYVNQRSNEKPAMGRKA